MSRLRVLITDVGAKHSIAIQRRLRARLSDIWLIGHDESRHSLARFYGCLDRMITGVALEDALAGEAFDMVIPVSARAVRTVSKRCPQCAVLPSPAVLERCWNKAETLALAQGLGIPIPATRLVKSRHEIVDECSSYPCVVKPACETEAKGVYYARNVRECQRYVDLLFDKMSGESQYGVLLQEYIKGWGCGFFALYDQGSCRRVFMHQRIREYPPSGGGSTAARAFYAETLKQMGLRLLNALTYHGVAMVEFRYCEEREQYVLMEINPKMWGSIELALCADADFAVDLVRLFGGEKLEYTEAYDRDLHFYWPLDDDLLHLAQTGQWHKVREYRSPEAATNVGQSVPADVYKSLRLLKKLSVG